jgi:DNA-directed RNA polymerase specialized sigma24 family protein
MLDRVSMGFDEDRRLLIALYSALVLNRYIDRCVVENAEDRQDITSRVFQTVFRRIESQGFERQGRGAFRGWLKITTKNKVGDFIRRERRRRGKSQALAAQRASLSADAGEIGDKAADEHTERALLIRQAIEVVRAEFEPASYEMARLQLLEGSSAVEAGASCGKSANAAYIAKCRVKRRLRELLDRFEIWETDGDPTVDRPGACS